MSTARRSWSTADGTPGYEHRCDGGCGSGAGSGAGRGYAAAPAQAHWSGDALLSSADPAELAEAVAQTVIAAGCDALNVRLHVPGVTPQEVRGQLAALREVVPQVQRLLRERLPQR